jgi:hypothetical protein
MQAYIQVSRYVVRDIYIYIEKNKYRYADRKRQTERHINTKTYRYMDR